jgi:hypothetical protein
MITRHSGQRFGPFFAVAPEVLRGGEFESPADVFSYGILVWDLTRFWMHNTEISVIPEGLVRVIESCLRFEKTDRPTMNEVREQLEDLEGDLVVRPEDVVYVAEEVAEKDIERVLGSQSVAMQAAASNSGFISFSY